MSVFVVVCVSWMPRCPTAKRCPATTLFRSGGQANAESLSLHVSKFFLKQGSHVPVCLHSKHKIVDSASKQILHLMFCSCSSVDTDDAANADLSVAQALSVCTSCIIQGLSTGPPRSRNWSYDDNAILYALQSLFQTNEKSFFIYSGMDGSCMALARQTSFDR